MPATGCLLSEGNWPCHLTTLPGAAYSSPLLSYLRSNFIIGFLSLFLAIGYACEVLDSDCDEVKPGQAEKADHGTKSSDGDDGCQCLCHQVFTAHRVEPVRIEPVALVSAEVFVATVEFPSDAVPLGIDHPPQLA